MQMSLFLYRGLFHVRTCQVVLPIDMMQKWLFVIKISVFNVFSYIFSIMILSIFMNMQIRLICKLDDRQFTPVVIR